MRKEVKEMLQDGVEGIFTGGKYAEYLKFLSSFRDYSFCNCVLIYSQKPEASLVCGYKAWEKYKRHVKKGETGIRILAPITKKRLNDDGTEDVIYSSFKAVSVFDISQTEGEPVPTICNQLSGTVEDFEKYWNKVVAFSPVPVSIEPIPANGCFDKSTNRILVNEGLDEAQRLKTLIHEVAHSLLHGNDGQEKEADRSTREVQAKSISFMVCNGIGLDTSDYSFGYIAGWSKNKDLNELKNSMDVIMNTSDRILKAVA